MIVVKPISFLNLKYDIIKDTRIGQLKIPFTRLFPSLRFGDIGFNIGDEQFYIVVPLRGQQAIGFLASEYRLVKENVELASAEFPARGSGEPFEIKWKDKSITFSKSGEKIKLSIDGTILGTIYFNHARKREDALDINHKIPVEVQVFSYFAYKKYAEVSLGI